MPSEDKTPRMLESISTNNFTRLKGGPCTKGVGKVQGGQMCRVGFRKALKANFSGNKGKVLQNGILTRG